MENMKTKTNMDVKSSQVTTMTEIGFFLAAKTCEKNPALGPFGTSHVPCTRAPASHQMFFFLRDSAGGSALSMG